jgi:hypothetical protein
VIVPDHMGFGNSETPPDREYTLRTHEGPVGDFDARHDRCHLTSL